MSKDEIIERYKGFLTEAVDACKAGTLTSLGEIKNKYGVSGAAVPFLIQSGIIIKTNKSSRYPAYATNRESPITDKEVTSFIQGVNRWRISKKNARTNGAPFPTKSRVTKIKLLSDYSLHEIMAELKHRGYTGVLKTVKEIKF